MEQKVAHAITLGVEQCRRFGVTTVGDISRQIHLSRPLLRNAKLRVVSFGEIMAMAQRRSLLEERIALATDTSQTTERLGVGLTPHSPYSVEVSAYRRCVEVAKELQLPLATHLAETAHEADFLAQHVGPLKDLWDAWLIWDDQVPTFAGGPIRMAKSVGLLDYPSLLAHVNYCDDEEMNLLAASQVSVIYCPRTHAYFGHPPHRWREMLAQGINVAAGTDSCASSPNLNLVDDLRLLHKLAPDLQPEEIWQMGTIRGAKALSMQNQVGSLTPEKFADIVAFTVHSESPLREVLTDPRPPHATWFDGIGG